MRKIFTALLVLIFVVVVGVKAYSDNSRQTEWENTRVIKTITVHQGDTLDSIGYEYKPSWIDVREYRYLIMELNDIDSAMIYQGQRLDVYVCTEHYTVQGLVMDNGDIITTDGNIWSYDTDIKGCVSITFSDYGTTDDITDDVIISIEEVK
jgi:hypothetical protein